MMDDGFWLTLTCITAGVGTYFFGKKQGFELGSDLTRKDFEARAQDKVILQLKKELEILRNRQEISIISEESSP